MRRSVLGKAWKVSFEGGNGVSVGFPIVIYQPSCLILWIV